MHRIWYANHDFLTDDRVVAALFDYASVLAVVNSSDVVTIPILDGDGVARKARLVIGPASQILAVPTDDEPADLPVADALADLARRSEGRLPGSDDIVKAGLPLNDPEATPLE